MFQTRTSKLFEGNNYSWGNTNNLIKTGNVARFQKMSRADYVQTKIFSGGRNCIDRIASSV